MRLLSVLEKCGQPLDTSFNVAALSVLRNTLNLLTRRPSTLPRLTFCIDGCREGSDVMEGASVD